MKINIALDAFNDEFHWRFLDTIIGKVADGWHVWQIEEPEAVEKSGWLEGRTWLRELFQKAALAAAYPGNPNFPQREVKVTSTTTPEALPPQLAAEFVSTPLTVLMENRFTDGLFLDVVLDFLAVEEVNEQRRDAPESIRYDSPGGNGELPKLIADYVRRAHDKTIPLRAVVFTDSDGEIPGEIKRDARLVQQACAAEGIPCAVLSKRTIENYIPDEMLDAWVPTNPDYEKRRIVEAVKRLKPEQRDHYPMKKGLKLSPDKPHVNALYQGVSDTDITELEKGFGSNVIEKLRDYRDALTPDALCRRDGQGALDRLIALITAEL